MAEDIRDVEAVADWMDTRFQVGGVRFGVDGILGFIPGVGDLITNLFSGYIIAKAVQLGYPAAVLMRMLGNLLIDNLLDAIPLLGNFFDIFFKANVRNVELMRRYGAAPDETRRRSIWWVLLMILLLIVITAAVIALSVFVAVVVYDFVRAAIETSAY